ncbi:MAG: hypothetical protein P1P85_01335 [Patescibacteria group bacterium]|nr:hypothetical protein [Patescibacteria group bacterium]
MKIVIGFDDTIFDTYKLTQTLLNNLKKAGYKSAEFKEIYKKAKEKKSDFNQKEIIDLLINLDFDNKMGVTAEIASLLKNSENFIYPDFYKFFNNFNKKDLILLSFGLTSLQKKKIKNSKVNNFFDKIYITDNKMEKLESIYRKYSIERLFFIDDKASEIDQAEKLLTGIVTIKIERLRGVYSIIKSEKTNFVVKNLSQAEKIIKKLTTKEK